MPGTESLGGRTISKSTPRRLDLTRATASVRESVTFTPSSRLVLPPPQQANGTDNGCSVPDSQFHIVQVVSQFPIREILFQLAEEWLVQQLRLILYIRNQGQGLGHVLGKPVIFSNWRASLRCSEVDAVEAPSNPLLYRV